MKQTQTSKVLDAPPHDLVINGLDVTSLYRGSELVANMESLVTVKIELVWTPQLQTLLEALNK